MDQNHYSSEDNENSSDNLSITTVIRIFVGGVLFLVVLIIPIICLLRGNKCMDKIRNAITLNQESQNITNNQLIISQPTSYLRTLSLPRSGPTSFLRTFSLPPTYQKAVCEEDCSKIETPPPEYHNLFFSKSSIITMKSISEE